ncbi:hypothetical protein [Parerythrobacter aestuarii]|uniref:hypothetical protein n=1 Tax=Parerythrobacter aestuarii TaxID=3020909 RepID=UPI0024DECF0F|nr:hypothetical protein [Parerythrobacter aestuarii]
MATAADTSAWIAFFVGLYVLAACVAELRSPGSWARLVEGLGASPALCFVTGAFTFMLGAAIYLVNPWNPGDWLSVLVTVIGGLAVAKGLFFITAPDRMLGLGRKVLGGKTGLIAGLDALLGAALLFAALSRLNTL